MSSVKSIFRSLRNKKIYSVINILGLAISLSTALLILVWVQDEYSFDKFHSNIEQIYKVNAHLNPEKNGDVWPGTPAVIANYAQELPQVYKATRIFPREQNVTLVDNERNHATTAINIHYIDSNFLSIFNFPLLEGNLSGFHSSPTQALITESTAYKIFNNQLAIGKTFRYDNELFTVAGILKDLPQNSSLQFDVLIPLEYHAQRFTKRGGNGNRKTIDEDLGTYHYQTFIKTNPSTDTKEISQYLTKSYRKAQNGKSTTSFVLAPLKSLHLISPDGNRSALQTVNIFSTVAFLLLLIGAINYINLSTARALDRAKDVGIRKIIGASRSRLFRQFIIETVVVFSISLSLALLFIFLLQSGYNDLTKKTLSYSLHNPTLWLYIAIAIFGTFCLSSIYPALRFSAFNPITTTQGRVSKKLSLNSLRKALVIFQFTISITLIICTLVIRNQLNFIQDINLGYDKEHVLTVELPAAASNHIDAIRTELTNNKAIQAVSLSRISNLTNHGESTSDIQWPSKEEHSHLVTSQASIDKYFIPLMDIQLKEGVNFSGLPSDSSSFIINEALAEQMGLAHPYVGTNMSLQGLQGQIIGVVKDFHYSSVKEKIRPMVFWIHWRGNTLYVKTTKNQAQQAISALQAVYKRYPSDTPFNYNFVDTQFDYLYKSERQTGLLFNIFSGVAILISTLGLFALATHDVQTRLKEIGIRKVLGASPFRIIKLLGRNFFILICVAIIIACPIAIYSMNKWLGNFAYKVELNIWVFIFGSGIAIFIAMLTISYQALKAATTNPVDSLRDE